MKLFIITSTSFYDKIAPIKEELENRGFELVMPNTYDFPNLVKETWEKSFLEYAQLKQKLFKKSEENIKNVDAVLCLNFEKNNVKNYIGGATFIEIYEAFKNNKKIYLYHDIPEGLFYDEIAGFEPIILNENLDLI